MFKLFDLFSGRQPTQLCHLLSNKLGLLLLLIECLVDPARYLGDQAKRIAATLLVTSRIQLCNFLIEQCLVECEAKVQQQLLAADLHVVLEDLGRVEVVRVSLALKGQVCESQRGKGFLEVVDFKLKDIVY